MSITTDNGKLAIMELDQDYEPGLPMSPGSIGQDDQQQLLWGFPEVLWGSIATGGMIYCLSAFPGKIWSMDSFSSLIVQLDAFDSECGGC